MDLKETQGTEMADKTIEEKFVLVVKHRIKAIITMIDNARDAGLTKVSSNDTEIIYKLVEAMEKDGKQAELVKMFIANSKYWDIVERKDVKGIEQALPQMFAALPVDKEGLSVPVKVYLAEKAKPASKKAPVIGDKHIEALWSDLDKLIKASIIYDHENGSAFKEQYALGKWYDRYNIGK